MRSWIYEYGLCLRRTWLVSLMGFMVLISLIAREFYALYFAVSTHEQLSLPNEVWWEVVYAVFCGTVIASLLATRVVVLRTYGYSSLVLGLTVLTLLSFIAYAYLTSPASSDSGCDSGGRCLGFYVLYRQDLIHAAAILFFLGTLLRTAITSTVALFTAKSKFQ